MATLMTLDEAIQHAEEVAASNREDADEYIRISETDSHPDREVAKVAADKCTRCAEEHIQLAEWLQDYKRLLELEANGSFTN